MSAGVHNNIFSKLILLSVFIIFTNGCSMSLNNSELLGTYTADYNIAEERLTLKNDGTFKQEVKVKNTSKTDISNGKWTYDTKNSEVVFHNNFLLPIDIYGEFNPDYTTSKSEIVIYPVVKFFGQIRIGSSEYILYKKIEDAEP